MNDPIVIVFLIVSAVVGIALGVLIGFMCRKKIAEGKIGSAEAQAAKLVEEGRKTAETAKKEALLQAKEEVMAQKNEMEQEIRERRAEISRTESRLTKKEENLDKKSEQLDKKNEQLDKRLKECDVAREQIDVVLAQHQVRLEEISGYSREEAKNELISRVESEIQHELAQKIYELEQQYKDEADEKARNIMALAIQRCAGDFVAEATISSVALPSEEMKGRIIGREGRNIQKLETLTGVELIIDDTPEVITITGFDPIRREVARLALEKLIADGRIHPTRIEEMVEKAKKDVDNAIKQAGERATFEVNVHGINPDLVRLLGRLRYRTSYGQNVLQH